ncbi:MAG: Hsp70 family protein [Synergistaceae bacterium]|nr:Hsp70 family protein [Synergistaceae bacterium]
MTEEKLSIGIDAGTKYLKAAHSGRITARLEGFDINALREESEIFLDDIVTACVIAVPENYSKSQRNEIIKIAGRSGFDDVNIIDSNEALIYSDTGSALICDFGASKFSMSVIDDNEILDSEIISDLSGNIIDKTFSEWLCERLNLNLIDNTKAEQIKISLSENESINWRGIEIFREDLERLIHFQIKRAAHTAKKFFRIYKPERVILTGGMCNIKAVTKIFADELNLTPEINHDLIAKGAAIAASSDGGKIKSKVDTAQKFKELRGQILIIEELLTRSQKDRLYLLVKQAEGINDAGILEILQNLIQEIKSPANN